MALAFPKIDNDFSLRSGKKEPEKEKQKTTRNIVGANQRGPCGEVHYPNL
jgi:hypothetical protein